MSAIGALAKAAGPILQVAAPIYGGISAYQTGKSEAEMEKYNAALLEQQAGQIEKATGFQQVQQTQEAARKMSSLEAQAGVSGAGGSPLLVMAEQASQSELENLMIGREGRIKAEQARSEASMAKMRGTLARQRGRAALVGGGMQAGGTILTGFA